MAAFNAGAFTPLGSVFIALSCFFLALTWRRGFFFSYLMKRLSVMMWLLQHKILPKTWPWTSFVQGEFSPEFQRRLNPPHALQRGKLLGVNKTGVSLKIHQRASILNAVSQILAEATLLLVLLHCTWSLTWINMDFHWCVNQKFKNYM